tara:strand:+ start:308 stop:742 length:435 start_codon:yes stop_codon:yes gene_type:complete
MERAMPRVILKPLDTYQFTWRMPVRTTDMNYANHLSACALVGMLDEAYTRFLRSLKLGHMGFGLPNVCSINGDLQVNYLSEGQLHDELTMEIAIAEIKLKSFRVFHRIKTGDRIVALAEVGAVCFDYQTKKTTALPQAFIDAVS